MAIAYFTIPETGQIIYNGDMVILSEYPDTIAVASYGWYRYNENAMNGWHFILTPSKTAIPAYMVNLSSISVVPNSSDDDRTPVPITPTPSCPTPTPKPPINPFLRDIESRAFITVDGLEQLQKLSTTFMPNGRIVRVNNRGDGKVGYYEWDVIGQDWDVWEIAEDTPVPENVLKLEELGVVNSVDSTQFIDPYIYYAFKAGTPLCTALDIPENTLCELRYSEIYQIIKVVATQDTYIRQVYQTTPDWIAGEWEQTYATKEYVDGELDSLDDSIQEELSGKEDKINKVTEITDGNTANQYPTVAAVKNYRNELLDKSRKNLIAFPNVPTTESQGVDFSINNNLITVSGTANATTNANLVVNFNPQIELEAGTYTASIRDEEGTPSNVMIYFYIQGNTNIAFQINGGGAKKIKYEPTETVFIRRIQIGVGKGKKANSAFHLQLEKGDEATDYEPPVDTYKIKNSLIPDNIPDRAYVKKAVNPMNYLYVSKEYDENTEGFGKTRFNSIIAANDSITDNSKENPYTIIVKSGTTAKPCVYDEFEDLYGEEFDEQYGGNTDEIPLQGIVTKNYVYYESETPDNPSACKLKWDGVEGYLKWDGEEDYKEGELTNELATKKCIFHLVNGLRGMHTHIKGFTIESKNTRYGIHMESGGYGRNEEWVVENCIIEYGGRPDVYKGDVTPIIGMGMSPHEKGTIRYVKAFFSDDFTAGIRALNCHDNYETTVYTSVPSVKVGAKLTIDNCNFGGYAIGLSKGNTQRTDPVSDTPFNAYLINNANISETVVSSGNWQAKGESVLVSGE